MKTIVRKIGKYLFQCPRCGCKAGVYLTYDGSDYVPPHFLTGAYMCNRCGYTFTCYDCSRLYVAPVQLSLFVNR